MCGLMRRTSYQKLEKVYGQNNPQSLKSAFKWKKIKDGFNYLAFN